MGTELCISSLPGLMAFDVEEYHVRPESILSLLVELKAPVGKPESPQLMSASRVVLEQGKTPFHFGSSLKPIFDRA